MQVADMWLVEPQTSSPRNALASPSPHCFQSPTVRLSTRAPLPMFTYLSAPCTVILDASTPVPGLLLFASLP